MSAGDEVWIEHSGRRIMLKWHMLRRSSDEAPFSMENLRDGLALGASMEIDIRLLGDGAWACLHDDVLDEETDGKGPVAGIDSAGLRSLRLAGSDRSPPLFAEIVDIIAAAPKSGALVQIDLKEPAATLFNAAVAAFLRLVERVAQTCLLSGTEWAAVERLGSAVPGLRLGFDPSDMAEGRSFPDRRSIEAFLNEVVAAAPDVEFSYLYHRFVSEALSVGINPIEFMQARGKKVDVWTLDPTTPSIGTILPRIVAAGADQITTNDPAGMSRLWRKLSAR